MPPVVALVLGAVGAVAFARWAWRESQRVNAILHPERADASTTVTDNGRRLRRDRSGIYRPD